MSNNISADNITANHIITTSLTTGTFVNSSLTLTNEIKAANVTATSDVTATNVTASGDISGSNVIASNNVTATNVNAANVTAANVTAANVTAANVTASGDISGSNVTANSISLNADNSVISFGANSDTTKIETGTESKSLAHFAGLTIVGDVPYIKFNIVSDSTYTTGGTGIGDLDTGIFKMYHYGLEIIADDGYYGDDTTTNNKDNYILKLRTQNEAGYGNATGGFYGMRFEKGNSDVASNYNLAVYMKDRYSPYNYHKIGKFENDTYDDGAFFTGQHRNIMNTTIDNSYVGLIVSSTGKYVNVNNTLEVSINESLPVCIISNSDNDKKVFGVISDKEDTSDGRSTGTGSYKTISKKANINEQRMYINSVGEGAIWVCNKNGTLENGDYITSSTVPGYGVKQSDLILYAYTVAKITCDCDFSTTKIVKQKLKVISTTDASGNTTTEIDYDTNGNVQYEDDLDENGNQQMVYPLETRFLQEDGAQITEAQYTSKLANGESVYIACFVGCTYHCG